MSWSIGVTGTKEEVKAQLKLQAQSPIAAYAGTPEEGDLKAALAACDRLIDAIVLDEQHPQVRAHAYGSHTTNGVGVTSAHFHVAVDRQQVG